MKTIVLARIEMTGLRKTERLHRPDGINWEYQHEVAPEPKALVWLNKGSPADCDKAREYAVKEGYQMFLYETSERDPITKAKQAIQAFQRPVPVSIPD